MQLAILLISTIFVYGMDMPIHTDQEHDRWEDVWSEITSGRRDLNTNNEWKVFLEAAHKRFKSKLFIGNQTKDGFAHRIIDLTIKNDVNTPGLYESQMILKYYPLHLNQTAELRITNRSEDAMKPPEMQVMLRNLKLEPAKTMQSLPGSASEVLTENDLLLSSSECKAAELSVDDINLSNLANFLGDGAIDSEVDSAGQKLEGGNSTQNACLLAKFLHHLRSKPKLTSYFAPDQLQDLEQKMLQASGTENLAPTP